MTDVYTLLDALREEADFQGELEKYYKANDSVIHEATARRQRESLQRIVNRFEDGKDYYLGIHDGKTTILHRQTDRHLIREYPLVKQMTEDLENTKRMVK